MGMTESAQKERQCDTCRYRDVEWFKEPCDSCTGGGETNHYEPYTWPEPKDSTEFWRKRAKYYSDICLDLIAEMGRGVKLDSIIINENGITFTKRPGCKEVRSGGDAISRQAAIDAINTWDKFGVDERGRLVRWYEGLELYVHLRDVLTAIVNLPPAQPELIEKTAYIRGFEQGRTQGMIDSQGGKK